MRPTLKCHNKFRGKFEIDSNGCWLWSGCLDKDGYGKTMYGGGNHIRSHRKSYLLHVGEIPEGLCVLHKCDVRACINPDHLFLGTNQENTIDRNQKERQARGESNAAAKLTEEDVRRIREEAYYPGILTILANRFGVVKSVIDSIRKGKTWKHLS